jgi:hypothetical protein
VSSLVSPGWLLKVYPFTTYHCSLVTNIKIILVAARSVFLHRCIFVVLCSFPTLQITLHPWALSMIYPRRMRICSGRKIFCSHYSSSNHTILPLEVLRRRAWFCLRWNLITLCFKVMPSSSFVDENQMRICELWSFHSF